MKLSLAFPMMIVQKARAWLGIALIAASVGVARGDRMAFPVAADQYEPTAKPQFERYDRVSAGIDASPSIVAAGVEPSHEFYKDSLAAPPQANDVDAIVEAPQSSPSSSDPPPPSGGAADEDAASSAQAVADLDRAASISRSKQQVEAAPRVTRPIRAVWQRHWRHGIILATTGCVALALLRYLCAARPEVTPPTRGRKPWLASGIRSDGVADGLGPPDYLAFFGLDEKAREADVVQAYREQSRRLHPDRGGDAAEFKAMQRRFEQAIAFVRRRGRGDRIESL